MKYQLIKHSLQKMGFMQQIMMQMFLLVKEIVQTIFDVLINEN